jgi:hypothetical protein
MCPGLVRAVGRKRRDAGALGVRLERIDGLGSLCGLADDVSLRTQPTAVTRPSGG